MCCLALFLLISADAKKRARSRGKGKGKEEEDFFGDGPSGKGSWKNNECFMVEIRNLQTIFGFERVIVRPIPSLDSVDVELRLPTNLVMTSNVCRGWGIEVSLPLIFRYAILSGLVLILSRLRFKDEFLECPKVPEFEIFQTSGNTRVVLGIGFQINTILGYAFSQALYWATTETSLTSTGPRRVDHLSMLNMHIQQRRKMISKSKKEVCSIFDAGLTRTKKKCP